ncbi:hypothetical protein LEP1GSC052_4281 [Leptospira kmetyi serovar Malaysia str. Bejo-Iso9]|nr:hypothetical protein LEP1GSC052_4281 [Leptospira kmetyi serovar Malaysia str. Bejo-Iso9]
MNQKKNFDSKHSKKHREELLAPFCVWTEHFKRKRCRFKFSIYNKIFLVIPKISRGRFIYFQKIKIPGGKDL